LIIRLTKIEEEVRVEREVLIWKAVTKIERIITEDKKKKRSSKKTRQEIDILKNEI
jgi:hypothetical protein